MQENAYSPLGYRQRRTSAPQAFAVRWWQLPSALMLALTAPALAQTTAPAASSGSMQAPLESSRVPQQALDEVIVTARRTEERARDLPFSVSLVSGTQLEQQRLSGLEDALRWTPGLELNSYSDTSNTSLRIRGVGALQKVSADDSSVAISVDGVPQAIANATLGLVDVARVEVLKGPQGTLFGRNSEAGAINIITRRPTQEREGFLQTELAGEGRYLAEGAFSGGLTDTLAGRLALHLSGTDNAVINQRDGKPVTRPRNYLARGSLLWDASASSQLFFSLERAQLEDRAGLSVLRPYADPALVDAPPGSMTDDKIVDRLALTLTHAFDNFMLTWVSGASRSDYETRGGFYDGLIFEHLVGFKPDSNRRVVSEEQLLSQELRIGSQPQSALFWTLGISALWIDRNYGNFDAFDDFYPESPFNADIQRDFGTDSYGLFGELTYPLTSRLNLTAGLRHSWEDKSYDALWRATATNPSALRAASDRQRLKDDFTTGRLAASYAITDSANLYLSFSRGYKAGGFNDFGTDIAFGLADAPYGPAEIDSLEAGYKLETAAGGLRLNAAVFDNHVEGDHLLVYNPMIFSTRAENFDTHTRGAELELDLHLGAGIALGGGIAYTDARIDRVPAASQAGVTADNRVPDSPRWSTALRLQHHWSLSERFGLRDAVLQSRLSHRYQSVRAADPQNNFDLPGYSLIDLYLGLSQGAWEFYLFADNLRNEQYDLYGYYFPPFFDGGADATFGVPSRGRILGAGMRMAF